MPGLKDKAMLVDLSVGMWDGRARNKEVESDVTGKAGAERDAGCWWTHYIPSSLLSGLRAAKTKIRAAWWDATLPWRNDGARILPAAKWLEFSADMRVLRAEWDAAVDTFVDEYVALVPLIPKRCGALASAVTLPSPEVVRAKCYFDLQVLPMPDVADFRVNVDELVADEIRGQMQTQIDSTIKAAMLDLWERLRVKVEHAAKRLADSDAILRESVFGNLREVCETVASLNLLDDSDLDGMRMRVMQELAPHKAEEVRDDDAKRAALAEKAKNILEAMNGLMGK